MTTRPIYLDYASTTPADPRVVAGMNEHLLLSGQFGNPGSTTHIYGDAAAAAVETAREAVANLIGAVSREIIWTSGATEANNLAIQGAAKQYAHKGRHIITLQSEHKAVLGPCQALEAQGFVVTYLKPQTNGILSHAQLEAALEQHPDTILVSIMHVNNETGVIQNIAQLSEATRKRNILLHVDAAQSAGKIPIDVEALQIDLLSMSAHKMYGPKGIGALYVRRKPRVQLQPLLFGGDQEYGLRSGTLPTHQIVGMGIAADCAREEMNAETTRIAQLRDRLWQGLQQLPGVTRHAQTAECVAHILSVSFTGIDGESLILGMPEIAVSMGSACTSATVETSHVLRAMGLTDQIAQSTLRFSLGRWTTEQDIDTTIAVVVREVQRLRALSPIK